MKVAMMAGALALALMIGSTSAAEPNAAEQGAKPAAAKPAIIPKGKDNDLKLYFADGRILRGAEAMSRMQKDAKVILWLAGNQFFAMDDVVKAFQHANPGMDVGLITLPPGLIMQAILAGSWIYEGVSYPGQPDVYASVNLGHLRSLKNAGLMDQYATYMHNELQIMVAKGNPKGIKGIKDFGRADVRTSNPNPVNEGIMQFYAKRVLERHGLWDQIAAGKMCYSCQTTPNNWFTSVHHRETPERIRKGESDAGIVWATEVLEAARDGAPVEGVTLPPEDSLRDEVAYAIGVLKTSPRSATAASYLEFLRSKPARDAYTKYGFVYASEQGLRLKPIP
jgi:ABC-type molybdate transport system substrate-binding protein